MPPRRVLPIRSRPESSSTNPGAGADNMPAASDGTSAATLAGGSSSSAAVSSSETNGFIDKKHSDKDGVIDDKKGERSAEGNGVSQSGSADGAKKHGKSVHEKISEPAPSPSSEMKDTMEDVIIAIVKGKQVSVRVKLNTKKRNVNDSKEKEAGATSPEARRPKRKRNNLYSSLAPAVMNAIVEERAKAYAEAPQRLHKQTKGNSFPSPQVDSKDVHPEVLRAETAAQQSGKVPKEYLGNDGNLFYCRICLGVGEVVCCDGCPQVFHPACIPEGMSKRSLENDDDPWYCPECVEKGMLGKSISQPKRKRKKVKHSDQDEALNQKDKATSPSRRSVKKRCGTCNKKSVENFPLVECSKQSCTSLFHFPGCPDRVGNDDYVFVDPQFGPLCPLCSVTMRGKNKDKSKNQEKVKGGRGGGRGSGKSGRGGGKGGRGHSSNGGRGSYNKTSPPRQHPEPLDFELKSSGYEAPYIEDNEENVGPHSLAFVEKPTQSIPAFFFFLMNNRNAIERSIQKKNRVFRSMPKSTSRNEIVAEAGAAIWLGLTDREKRAWVELAVNDFQDRVIAWKEKEAIEAMVKVEDTTHSKDAADTEAVSIEDDNHASDFRARTLQFSTLETTRMKPTKGNNNNNVLLELLHDNRFNPVPLVSACRDEKDLLNSSSERAVAKFAVQGPIKTSIGDECLGCVRGWRHFCPVLNHTVPHSASRSLLQPPTSSLLVTRIGLGLERSDGDTKQCLHDPSLRRDDVTTFIEDAVAVKTLMPNPDKNDDKSTTSEVDGLNELTSSRKRNRPSDSGSTPDHSDIEKRRYKCSRCSTVQFSPFGCNGCRREQLVKETAFRDFIAQSSISADFLNGSKALSRSHNYDEGFLKSKCTMLPYIDSGKGENINADNLLSTIDQLTKESWSPCAVLPPESNHIRTPNLDSAYEGSDINSDLDDTSVISTSTSASSDDGGACKSPTVNGAKHNEKTISPASPDDSDEPHSMRKSRRTAVDAEEMANRQIVAVKHKENANELSRKCLSIACSGILMGMVRRDPLRLFAKPPPSRIEEYHKVIKNPIDFQTMRQKLASNEYATLGSFVSDAKRLCINACVFNAADSIYALTAKSIFDSLTVMVKRAQQWITILKNTHASSFISNDDDCAADIFKDVKLMWPGAVELLNDGSWLEEEAQADFVRTKENEIAYYGALTLRRAAIAASEAFGASSAVAKRSHIEDELLRERIDHSVSSIGGPASLKSHPEWREVQVLKLLKNIQKHRIDIRSSSKAGCARCDVIDEEREKTKNLSILPSSATATPRISKHRIDPSRSFQSTGLASRNAHNKSAAEESDMAFGNTANEALVSVKGSKIHGWGLYADNNFKQGDVVAEYIGEYISNAVADARENYYRKQRIQDYQFRVNDKIVIDATLKGGHARYINHSCQPNCVAKIIEGEPPNEHLMRVVIIARRDIDAAEELTYNYHFPLETDLAHRVPCNCGSPKCHGYMNWNIPEKMKWESVRKNGSKGRVNSKKV